ncbi:hypothetical protein IVA96_05775 [Bradyrhizobium sp. 159]|uniref:hypothetical protein n=1 Tax=unclassified Bradyrhizobium TaxID=2631580 RepID=UPI001FFB707D|nr:MULTISPECIES: hypothetical protein [unclassified Bradyrhizobium]MCK1616175.1 hypothetical protein [Bradyrhizobium sp. 159]MCK1757439.1 hypothetical protein [Bradyrhizobium sp. 137]
MTDEMLSPFASAVAFAMSGAILLWSNHRQLELVFEAIVSATLYFLATKDYTRRRLLQRYGRDNVDLVGRSMQQTLNVVAPGWCDRAAGSTLKKKSRRRTRIWIGSWSPLKQNNE